MQSFMFLYVNSNFLLEGSSFINLLIINTGITYQAKDKVCVCARACVRVLVYVYKRSDKGLLE